MSFNRPFGQGGVLRIRWYSQVGFCPNCRSQNLSPASLTFWLGGDVCCAPRLSDFSSFPIWHLAICFHFWLGDDVCRASRLSNSDFATNSDFGFCSRSQSFFTTLPLVTYVTCGWCVVPHQCGQLSSTFAPLGCSPYEQQQPMDTEKHLGHLVMWLTWPLHAILCPLLLTSVASVGT